MPDGEVKMQKAICESAVQVSSAWANKNNYRYDYEQCCDAGAALFGWCRSLREKEAAPATSPSFCDFSLTLQYSQLTFNFYLQYKEFSMYISFIILDTFFAVELE